MMDEKELKEFLKGLETSVVNLVRTLPEHQKFIDNYCKVSA